ncbi:MAG: ABC transporter ATP-binding protein [Candidatus Omnitrophica bacterium]|nr:ABC transporter ATP-binding protein [Candidatus Omnitrophota bacterium]
MILSSVFTSGVSIGMIIPLVDRVLGGKPIVITGYIPDFLKALIIRINSIPPYRLLNYMIFWLILVFMLKALFTFFQSYFMNDASQRVVRDIKEVLYSKFLTLPINYFDTNRAGTLVSRITYDAGVIQNSITEGLTDLIYHSLQILVCLCAIFIIKVAFSISWFFLLVSLIIPPLVVLPIVKIGRKLRKISRQSQEKMADINTMLYETITGMRIVKAFAMEDYERNRFIQQNNQFYKINMKSIKRMIAIGPFSEFIGIVTAVFILWFGGKEVVLGRLSLGAFIAYLAALLSLVRPFNRLSRVYGVNQQALAAATRIFVILDTEPLITQSKDAVELSHFKEKIEFKDVSFNYDGQEVLKDINFSVKAGDIIAVVGPSGVGKTTLVNLIPRFYDPLKGAILIDGKDIREITLKSLRERIGIVTQETILFNDTVFANITYGRLDIPRQAVFEAAKVANAHDFIMRLPRQYDTILGERGFKISGGERQRVAIARAVLKNPPILILDEATSQLDSESELLVQQAIENLMRGRTVFLIAHRLSTIRHASKIVVLENGRIVEMGTQDELLEKNGAYKRYYAMQFR